MPPRENTADAVPLDELAGLGGKKDGASLLRLANFKVLISIFIIFALVVSNVFTDNVVSGFRGAVSGRTPTSYGVVVQGIFVVIFYVVSLHMIDEGIV